MSTVLLKGGPVHAPGQADATAMLVDGDSVAWVGSHDAAAGMSAETVVDLDGALVTPAFVDAHVHCLDTGLLLTGVDLTGATSLTQVLDAVAAAARARPGTTVLGHGWDETRLAEGRAPTTDEVTRAAPGAHVYLTRIDVHSAVVSRPLIEAASLAGRSGYHPDGPVRADAHHAARAAARRITETHRRQVHEVALRAAAAAGIGYVHEMSGPDLVGPDDLAALMSTAAQVGVRVVPYWAQLARGDLAGALAASGAGAAVAGLAGDLCVDGSLGSRTAALRHPYADGPGTGLLYLDADEVADHVAACGSAGVQAGFHVIGDAGLDAILAGLDRVTAEHGAATVRRARVRLEHVESADDTQLAALVRHGVTASVQPAFDATWGGPGGMYAVRLGPQRGGQLNRFASLATSGVPVAFGSDSPVTPFDPWGAVAAAVGHHRTSERISPRAAFAAHTRGAHRAGPATGSQAGLLAPGAPASYTVWQVGELGVWAPDGRIQAWSTDPRSATPALPDLAPGAPRPRCLRTVVDGRLVFDSGDLS